MTVFIIVAAVMAVLAAAAVAVPLLRDRRSRWAGAFAALVVIGSAAALYPFWSNWNWHDQGKSTAPDVLAMVAKLEDRMRSNPDDLTGWLMLGRSYLTLERLDDAILAFDHAHRLDPDNAEAALGLGEAVSLRAGGNITPAAAELFDQALKLAPNNPKALLYAGFAAATRGDTATARARWQALKDLHPPEAIDKMLDERMAELDAPGAAGGGPAGGQGAAPVRASAPSQSPASASAAESDAAATVTISLAPALKSRLTTETPMFVFAREPGGGGPPLAAKRLTTAALGTSIRLSASDSMIPGRVLTSGRPVSITARISFGGQPLPAAGDLYGELTYDVGHDGHRDLVIDRVAQ